MVADRVILVQRWLVNEFIDAFHFTEHSKNFISFNEDRCYWAHDNYKILKQMLFQLITGYKAHISANILQYNPVLQPLSTDGVGFTTFYLSFFDRITEQLIEDLQTLNQVLIG